jgi:capsule assembly protein Wzi
MIRKLTYLFILLLITANLNAQVEHVAITHPVYDFLLRAETRGFLPHFSLADLPLQRKEITKALELINKNKSKLSESEIELLAQYYKEFELVDSDKAVVIYSETESTQVFSSRMFSDDEKFIYYYKDSANNVKISPLASVDGIYRKQPDSAGSVLMGNLGVRLFGSLGKHFGYYLQVTNGAVFAGDRLIALEEDDRLGQNIKFAKLGSDFDFSESHLRFEYDWFYATIGRESRQLGAGMNQRVFMSTYAPPIDAISIGAKFETFEYKFTHGSLLALPDDSTKGVGFYTTIPSKYMAMHRFAVKPAWGEIAFWESVIYSGRGMDLAYLNPLSFFKTLEHSLRDRDNSMMGLDATVRVIDGVQIKGSFILDDIIFDSVGTEYWSNKWAWNIAVFTSLIKNLDIGIEYSKVKPYMFSHFNPQNSMTNDSLLFGGYLMPNSDQWSLLTQWWWGGRYPVKFRIDYMRHGKNIYDENGDLVFNAGSDPFRSNRSDKDNYYAPFLAGDREDLFRVLLQGGVELYRGFNIHGVYQYKNLDENNSHSFRMIFRFEDF